MLTAVDSHAPENRKNRQSYSQIPNQRKICSETTQKCLLAITKLKSSKIACRSYFWGKLAVEEIKYRVFFHWASPEKFKYGKPRLGEVRCMLDVCFPYFDFLEGGPVKKHPVHIYIY